MELRAFGLLGFQDAVPENVQGVGVTAGRKIHTLNPNS